MRDMAEEIFAIHDLEVGFLDAGGLVYAVQGVTFGVRAGEVLAVVGESGSGKSASLLGALGLLPANGRRLGGTVEWGGEAIGDLEMEGLRGKEVAVIFQDPIASMDPLMPVGKQVAEVLVTHMGLGRKASMARVLELFRLVGISDPERRARQFPFELSGGMAQRVMIALALAVEPRLLVADEPTTALDVTIQAQVLDLLEDLRKRLGIATILVTHDLGIVDEIADRVVVMYAGRVVESGSAQEVTRGPIHPYTRALLAATPDPSDGTGGIEPIGGGPPELRSRLMSCGFADRCALVSDLCRSQAPGLLPVGSLLDGYVMERKVACFNVDHKDV